MLAAGDGWDGITGGRGSTEGGEERDMKHRTATAKLRPGRRETTVRRTYATCDEQCRLGTK